MKIRNSVLKLNVLGIVLFFFAISESTYAQKDLFPQAEKFSSDSLNSYIHNTSLTVNWLDSSSLFYYRVEEPNKTNYYLGNAKNGKKEFLFTNLEIGERLAELIGESEPLKDWNTYQLAINPRQTETIGFSYKGKAYSYNRKNKELTEIRKAERRGTTRSLFPRSGALYWQKLSTDSTYYVYGYKHNLYIGILGEGDSVALTSDGEVFNSYVTSSETTNEQKSSPMVYWMKNSHKIVGLREDRRAVGEMTLINSLSQPRPTTITYKFPTPGDSAVSQYSLYLFDAEKKTSKQLDISKYPDQRIIMQSSLVNGRTYLYAGPIGSHERYVYFLRRSRTNDRIDLCRLDTEREIVEELISEETQPHFNEQLFTVRILNEGEDILWWSERTGYGTYYLYDRNGKLKSSLGNGDFVSGDILKIDTAKRQLITEAYGLNPDFNPYYRQYIKVNFDGSGFKVLTPEEGYHDISLSPTGDYYLDSYSTVQKAPVHELRKINGAKVMDLAKSDLSALKSKGWKAPEPIKMKAADGVTDLYGVLYTPSYLDSTKTYPVISNVYPGPQDDYVPRKFSIDDNYNQTLAELGFVVMQMPARGSSPLRGLKFHSYSYGNLRDYALEDDKHAIETLAVSRPFMDLDRVGIYGHSGGGFMSATAILTYPDFYKVAVAASGNYDPNIYTQWWSETYHGITKTETGFKSDIPTTMELAKNLNGNLFLITGDVDKNVHPAHTLRLADALIKNNKRFDMLVLPGKDHGLGDKYYINLIRYYFLENLLKKESSDIDIVNHQ